MIFFFQVNDVTEGVYSQVYRKKLVARIQLLTPGQIFTEIYFWKKFLGRHSVYCFIESVPALIFELGYFYRREKNVAVCACLLSKHAQHHSDSDNYSSKKERKTTHSKRSFQISLLGSQFVSLVFHVFDDVSFAAKTGQEFGLLDFQSSLGSFDRLAESLLSLESGLGIGGLLLQCLFCGFQNSLMVVARFLLRIFKERINFTLMVSSIRVTLSRGLTFCHRRYQAQVRSCMYLRMLRWTTCRAKLLINKIFCHV